MNEKAYAIRSITVVLEDLNNVLADLKEEDSNVKREISEAVYVTNRFLKDLRSMAYRFRRDKE